MRFRRTPLHEVPVGPGERVLASAAAADGTVVAGTRDAFYAVHPDGSTWRLPWELVEAADWDQDTDTFRLSEVGTWGQERREVDVVLPESRRLLELVRERVTASIVLQRHVPVEGRRGVRVIGRRAPRGDQPITWVYEYDDGIDPEDPVVIDLAREALAVAVMDVGVS
jgi:hypothetical protein